MKKIIALLLLAVAFLASLCSCTEIVFDCRSIVDGTPTVPSLHSFNDDYGTLEGYYLLSSNGSHMIIADNQGPCVISAAGGVLFNGLTDGDRIRVKTSDILESYPGQLTAFSLEKLSDGERSDIDAQTLKTLAELGWIKE